MERLIIFGILIGLLLIFIAVCSIVFIIIKIIVFACIKKKIPVYAGIPLSVFLIVVIASCFTFGWGWFVPYSLQPSYWQFKKMCELNDLPNNEEKYNKILGYFGKSLDTLDWEELSKNTMEYDKNTIKVADIDNDRYSSSAYIIMIKNYKEFIKDNIDTIKVYVTWHTRQFLLSGGDLNGFELSEEEIICADIVKSKEIK